MQSYKEIALSDVARDAVMQLQENIETIASNNAGTSFPTENLYDGMLCYRTDEKRYYTYSEATKTWESLFPMRTELQRDIVELNLVGGSEIFVTERNRTTTKMVIDNVDNSKKAVQDASGNVITSTYATKTELNAKAPTASPTFTGILTAETVTVTDNLNIPGGRIWIE